MVWGLRKCRMEQSIIGKVVMKVVDRQVYEPDDR